MDCPQPADGIDEPPFALTANVDSCCSSFSAWHLGHSAFCSPKTIASNLCPQDSQRYSKIGIVVSRTGQEGCRLRRPPVQGFIIEIRSRFRSPPTIHPHRPYPSSSPCLRGRPTQPTSSESRFGRAGLSSTVTRRRLPETSCRGAVCCIRRKSVYSMSNPECRSSVIATGKLSASRR